MRLRRQSRPQESLFFDVTWHVRGHLRCLLLNFASSGENILQENVNKKKKSNKKVGNTGFKIVYAFPDNERFAKSC